MQPETQQPGPDARTIETAEDLIADVLQRSDVVADRSPVGDETAPDAPTLLAHHEPVAADDTWKNIATDTPERSFGVVNDAIDEASVVGRQPAEVLEQSRVPAQHPLDGADLRAAAIVDHHDEAKQVLDEARSAAAAMLQAAQREADEMTAGAAARVDIIKDDAWAAALEAVAVEREVYKAKATQITEAAIADAQLLVTHAAMQAQDMMKDAATKAVTTDQLVAEKLAKADTTAEAILERTRREAAQATKSRMAEATEQLESSAAEAEQLIADARHEADELRQEAQLALAAIEETKEQARRHVADAIRRATEDTTARTRKEIEAQLSDIQRETKMLEEQAANVLEKTKSDVARTLSEAEEEANLIRARANIEASATIEEANATRARANERARAITQDTRTVAATIEAAPQD